MADNSTETKEWIALINQLKQHMHEGAHSPRVQTIIARMEEKKLATFAGEDAFIDKLWTIRLSPEQSEKIGLYPLGQELLLFLKRAYAAYEAKGDEG